MSRLILPREKAAAALVAVISACGKDASAPSDAGPSGPVCEGSGEETFDTVQVVTSSAGREFFSISPAADVNGDGFADLVAGTERDGAAEGFLGGTGGIDTESEWSIVRSEDPNHYFGSAVGSAGDLNGDGYGDVAVGDWGYQSYDGSAFIYLGGPSGVDPTTERLWVPQDSRSHLFGNALSSAGDVNDDGFDDLIVGAMGTPGTWYDAGAAYVSLGGPDGLDVETEVKLFAAQASRGEGSGESFGVSVSDAGDVDGDGYGDAIVGALEDFCAPDCSYYCCPLGTGAAWVFQGSPDGIVSEIRQLVSPWEHVDGSHFGESVSGAGDVDADGYDDVIVGAPWVDSDGAAYCYLGSIDGIDKSSEVKLGGPSADGGRTGHHVSDVGDWDGDGFGDVVISRAHSGYVYRGSSSGLDNSSGEMLVIPDEDVSGETISGVGDVDCNGFSDVALVGSGAVYVFPGGM